MRFDLHPEPSPTLHPHLGSRLVLLLAEGEQEVRHLLLQRLGVDVGAPDDGGGATGGGSAGGINLHKEKKDSQTSDS